MIINVDRTQMWTGHNASHSRSWRAHMRPHAYELLIRRRRRWNVMLLLGIALVIAGCAVDGDVLVPPRADVAGIQVVAVFPFANDTALTGLEDEVVDRLVAGLQAVGWYEVVPMERVAELLAQQRPSVFWDISDSRWLDRAREIAAEAGADGFIVGRVVDYAEEVTMGAPYAMQVVAADSPVDDEAVAPPTADNEPVDGPAAGGESDDGLAEDHEPDDSPAADQPAEVMPPEWRVDQTTRVAVTLEARLVNVHTGDIVYEQRAVGIGRIDEPRLLNWALPSEPPETLIPTAHRRDVPRARDLAVDQAFVALTRDILPQVETGAETGAGEPNDASATGTTDLPAAEATNDADTETST